MLHSNSKMDDVRSWLESNGLGDLVERFERGKLNTLSVLLKLEETDLKEIVPELGFRVLLREKLQELRSLPEEETAAKNPIQQSVLSAVDIVTSIPEIYVPDQSGSSSILEIANETVHQQPCDDRISSDENSGDPAYSPSPCHSNSEGNTSDSGEAPTPKRKIAASCSGTGSIHSSDSNKKRKVPGKLAVGPSKHIASANALKYFKSLTTVDLEKLLREFHAYSEAAVDRYQQSGFLTDKDRTAITAAVASQLLKHNYTPSSFEFTEAAEKICELFPCEQKETYYIPPKSKEQPASGKLFHKVKNDKSAVARRGAEVVKTPKQASQTLGIITKPAVLNGSTNVNDENVRKAILCLKHESRDNWPQLMRSWSVTHPLRFLRLRQSRPSAPTSDGDDSLTETCLVSDYLSEWDVLKLPAGFKLLTQDFDELFPNCGDRLFARWELERDRIIQIVQEEVGKSDVFGSQLLKQYADAPADKRDVIAFLLLPSLCCKRGRGGKASLKVPSMQEARRTFLLHVESPGDLKKAIRNQHDLLRSLGLRVQPMLAFVGPNLSNITASYVQIDGILYHIRTPLAALDCCFKVFFALDAAYPDPCKAVWYFIQSYFYGLHLEGDKPISRVTGVISSLKGLASKSNES